MTIPNPEKTPLKQLLWLVDQCSPSEFYVLRRKLDNKIWNDQLDTLFSRIDERNKGLPPPSEEEIVAVIKEIRQELKANPVSDTALLSEQALAKDWMKPEEDKAWSDL